MLNERGISAVTPSCLNTPSGPNAFSPTLTPCNSPECQSPTLESQERAYTVSLTSFLSSSAGLLKKKITRQNNNNNNSNSNNNQETDKAAIILERKVKQRTINLLKEVETLGIENILLATSSSSSTSRFINKPLALHSSNIYTTRHSPMTQLTSLKHLSDNRMKSSESSSESDKKSNMSAGSSTNNNNNINSSKGSPEARVKQKLQRHKTRRNLNSNAVQRPDLGTVNGTKAADKPKDTQSKPGLVGGFVGSISSIFFGRKGGFL